MALLVYVDDIVIAGPYPVMIKQVQAKLQEMFKLKVLGSLKYFPGLEIATSKHGINLSQRKYVPSLLDDTGFLTCKPAALSMDPNLKLSTTDGEPLQDISQYPQCY